MTHEAGFTKYLKNVYLPYVVHYPYLVAKNRLLKQQIAVKVAALVVKLNLPQLQLINFVLNHFPLR